MLEVFRGYDICPNIETDTVMSEIVKNVPEWPLLLFF